jgi:integrase
LKFEEFMESWARRKANPSPSVNGAMVGIRKHFYPHLAQTEIESLQRRHLARALLEINDIQESTKAKLLHWVRAALREAIQLELMQHDPTMGFRLRKSRSGRARWFSVDEVATLLNDEALEPHEFDLLILLFLTGMRIGEAIVARWVDLGSAKPLRSLEVSRAYSVAAKAIGPRKMQEETRVPVHPLLNQHLTRLQHGEWQRTYKHKPKPEDFLAPFPTRTGSRRWGYKGARLMLKNACERNGLEYRSLHKTRHTFISMLANAGATPEIYKRWTHSARGGDVFTSVYFHPSWEVQCEQMLKLRLDQIKIPL